MYPEFHAGENAALPAKVLHVSHQSQNQNRFALAVHGRYKSL